MPIRDPYRLFHLYQGAGLEGAPARSLGQTSGILAALTSRQSEERRRGELLAKAVSEGKIDTKSLAPNDSALAGKYMGNIKAPSGGGIGGFFSGVGGFLGNLGSDIGNTAKGIPAGGVKTTKAITSDVLSLLQPVGREWGAPGSDIKKEVVDPTVGSYKYMYGGEGAPPGSSFFERFYQHPLQPILDAATVASLGAGGLARAGVAPALTRTTGRSALDLGEGAEIPRQYSARPLRNVGQRLTDPLENVIPPFGRFRTQRGVKRMQREQAGRQMAGEASAVREAVRPLVQTTKNLSYGEGIALDYALRGWNTPEQIQATRDMFGASLREELAPGENVSDFEKIFDTPEDARKYVAFKANLPQEIENLILNPTPAMIAAAQARRGAVESGFERSGVTPEEAQKRAQSSQNILADFMARREGGEPPPEAPPEPPVGPEGPQGPEGGLPPLTDEEKATLNEYDLSDPSDEVQRNPPAETPPPGDPSTYPPMPGWASEYDYKLGPGGQASMYRPYKGTGEEAWKDFSDDLDGEIEGVPYYADMAAGAITGERDGNVNFWTHDEAGNINGYGNIQYFGGETQFYFEVDDPAARAQLERAMDHFDKNMAGDTEIPTELNPQDQAALDYVQRQQGQPLDPVEPMSGEAAQALGDQLEQMRGPFEDYASQVRDAQPGDPIWQDLNRVIESILLHQYPNRIIPNAFGKHMSLDKAIDAIGGEMADYILGDVPSTPINSWQDVVDETLDAADFFSKDDPDAMIGLNEEGGPETQDIPEIPDTPASLFEAWGMPSEIEMPEVPDTPGAFFAKYGEPEQTPKMPWDGITPGGRPDVEPIQDMMDRTGIRDLPEWLADNHINVEDVSPEDYGRMVELWDQGFVDHRFRDKYGPSTEETKGLFEDFLNEHGEPGGTTEPGPEFTFSGPEFFEDISPTQAGTPEEFEREQPAFYGDPTTPEEFYRQEGFGDYGAGGGPPETTQPDAFGAPEGYPIEPTWVPNQLARGFKEQRLGWLARLGSDKPESQFIRGKRDRRISPGGVTAANLFEQGGDAFLREPGPEALMSGAVRMDPKSFVEHVARRERDIVAQGFDQNLIAQVAAKDENGEPTRFTNQRQVEAALGPDWVLTHDQFPVRWFVGETEFLRDTINKLQEMQDMGIATTDKNVLNELDQLASDHAQEFVRKSFGAKRIDGVAVPRNFFEYQKRLVQATDPFDHPAGRAYARYIHKWRTLTLAYMPRWAVNTAVGSFMLNMVKGVGPRSYRQAGKLKRQGAFATPELSGVELGGVTGLDYLEPGMHGVGGSIERQTGAKVSGFGERIVEKVQAIEDYFRKASFVHSLDRATKQRFHDMGTVLENLEKRKGVLSDNEFLNQVLQDPELVRTAIDDLNRFSYNFASLGPYERRYVRMAIPFWGWYKFISKFAYRLPAEYPGRTNILANVGMLGNMSQEEYGQFPEWMRGFIPLANKEGQGLSYFSTLGVNPLGQFFNPLGKQGVVQGAINVGQASPPIQAGLGALGVDTLRGGVVPISPQEGVGQDFFGSWIDVNRGEETSPLVEGAARRGLMGLLRAAPQFRMSEERLAGGRPVYPESIPFISERPMPIREATRRDTSILAALAQMTGVYPKHFDLEAYQKLLPERVKYAKARNKTQLKRLRKSLRNP